MDKVSENPLKNRNVKYLLVAAALYVTMYITANMMSVRIFKVGSLFCVDAGTLVFPFIYVIGDAINELWGLKVSRHVIVTAFVCDILFVGMCYIASTLPHPEYMDATAEAYEAVFGFAPRIVLGSITGFLIGALLNAQIFNTIRRLTNGKHLWLRAITSSVTGLLFDTIPFALVAFAGIVTWHDIVLIVAVNFIAKTVIEIGVGTPMVYLIVKKIKRRVV